MTDDLMKVPIADDVITMSKEEKYEFLTVKRFLKEFAMGGTVIAYDGKDGKRLFDTSRNTAEHIDQFAKGIIIGVWAELKDLDAHSKCSKTFTPVVSIYVSHNSWEKE